MDTDRDQTILDISASIVSLEKRMPAMDAVTRKRAERTCSHLNKRIAELQALQPERKVRRVRAGFRQA